MTTMIQIHFYSFLVSSFVLIIWLLYWNWRAKLSVYHKINSRLLTKNSH